MRTSNPPIEGEPVQESPGPTQNRKPLEFPPAITIRSAPFPPSLNPPSHRSSPPPPTSLYPPPPDPPSSSSSTGFSGPNSTPLGLPKNRYPPNYPSYANWKEWHINPSLHGPEGSKGPPIFVASQLKYDELGRSVIDGVGVEVSGGDEEDREGRENGGAVAEWYTTLAGRRSTTATADEEVEAGPSKPRVISEGVIDFTGSDEDDDIFPPAPKSPIQPPLRVHQSEWFIRRALASSGSTTPTLAKPSTSIGNLLNIAPTVDRAKEPVYVLGRDHIGHQILRERLGWGGGGLGRPEGWIPMAARIPHHLEDDREDEAEELRMKAEGSREDAIVISDTDDDTSAHESSPEPPTISGPGRLAPIATTLKLDRLGLGHRLAAEFRSKSKKGKEKLVKEGEGRKKVTHSHDEILEAQRRARYARSGAVQKNGTGEVLGKKGKIRWKEKDKKERDERRRMIAALND